MDALIGMSGLIGFFVSLVLLLIALIRRKPKRKIGIALTVFFALFVVGLLMPTGETTTDDAHSNGIESDQPDEEGVHTVQQNKEPNEQKETQTEQEIEPECTHDWREIIRDEPTYDAQGISYQQCAICSEERKQFIPKLEKVVTFEDIYTEYKANELRADEMYKNNRYVITGEINGMNTGGLLNWSGGATLTMETRVGNTRVFLYAEFEKDQEEALKAINVGDTITFEGECLSWGNWSDCILITE